MSKRWSRSHFGWLTDWTEDVDALTGSSGCSSGCAIGVLVLIGLATILVLYLSGWFL
jgi:hypothetical protein